MLERVLEARANAAALFAGIVSDVSALLSSQVSAVF